LPESKCYIRCYTTGLVAPMGSISARRRANGSTGYTAQIRLKHEGRIVHSEAETFSTRALAKEWLTRREAALEGQRARGEPVGRRMTMGELVAWYQGRERLDQPWGRSKRADLARLKAGSLSDIKVDALGRREFIAYVEARRAAGAGPATAGNDVIWLRSVFKAAGAVLGIPVPLAALDEAGEYLRSARIVAKSRSRDRRLTADEERRILEHLARRDGRGEILLVDVVQFALLTCRRQEEITRLQWADLNKEKGTALLRDAKHPRQKLGNHRVFKVPVAAWAIIDRQPRLTLPDGTLDPRIFPFNPKSIGAAFARATKLLGIEDLTFHDLRHEATSRLFERGYSIQEVAQFSLHESWTTLKRYTHLKPEDVPER